MNTEHSVNLYFARHGKTHMNSIGALQSYTDTRHSTLTPEGKHQAHSLKNYLADVSFPHMYSSPYVRALQTAEIVANNSMDVIPVPALVERSFGKLEGTRYSESMNLRHSFLVHQSDADYQNIYEIETDNELRKRLIPLLEKIAIAHLGMNALFVTHSGIMRFILHELIGLSYEELKDVNITEASHMHIRANFTDAQTTYELMSTNGITNKGRELNSRIRG